MKIPVFEVHGCSDAGLFRPNNEDVFMSLPEHHFFAIADGMGGHNAGEIAAKEATQTLCLNAKKHLTPTSQPSLTLSQIISHLRLSIKTANQRVYDLGQTNEHFKGMGTTLCCLYLHEHAAIYAHVGDSRLYHFRQNTLQQLTKDHSLANKILSKKQNEDTQPPSSYRNIITKAIGTSISIEPEIAFSTLQIGDVFFLCTDGLSDFLTLEEMSTILKIDTSVKETTEKLIQKAKEKGSRDNISIILLKITSFYEKNLP